MSVKAWNPTVKAWIGDPVGSAGNVTSFSVGSRTKSSFGVKGTPNSSFKTGLKTSSNKATGGGKTVNSGVVCGVGQVAVAGKCVGVNVKTGTSTLRTAKPASLKATCPNGYSLVNGACQKRAVTVSFKTAVQKTSGSKSSSGGGKKTSSSKSSSGGGQFVYSSGTGTRITGTAKEVSKYGGQKGSFAKK